MLFNPSDHCGPCMVTKFSILCLALLPSSLRIPPVSTHLLCWLMSHEEIHWVGWSMHYDHVAVVILLSIQRLAFWFGPSITEFWHIYFSGLGNYEIETQTLGYGEHPKAQSSRIPTKEVSGSPRSPFISIHCCSHLLIYSGKVYLLRTYSVRCCAGRRSSKNDSPNPHSPGGYSPARKAILLKTYWLYL